MTSPTTAKIRLWKLAINNNRKRLTILFTPLSLNMNTLEDRRALTTNRVMIAMNLTFATTFMVNLNYMENIIGRRSRILRLCVHFVVNTIMRFIVTFVNPITNTNTVERNRHRYITKVVARNDYLFIGIRNNGLNLISLNTSLLLFRNENGFFTTRRANILTNCVTNLISNGRVRLTAMDRLIGIIRVILIGRNINTCVTTFTLTLAPISGSNIGRLKGTGMQQTNTTRETSLIQRENVINGRPRRANLTTFRFTLCSGIQKVSPPLKANDLNILCRRNRQTLTCHILVMIILANGKIRRNRQHLNNNFNDNVNRTKN